MAATYQDPNARARAIGIWGAGSGLGVAAGPLIGGVVVEWLGWRWAFGFNVPVAALLAVLALRFVPADGPPDTRTRFDGLGRRRSSPLFVGSLVFGIIEAADRGWDDPRALIAFAVALVTAAPRTFVQERRSPAPLIDLALLRQRTFAVANAQRADRHVRAAAGDRARVGVPAALRRRERARGRASRWCPTASWSRSRPPCPAASPRGSRRAR